MNEAMLERFFVRGAAAQKTVDALAALHRLLPIAARDHGQACRVRRFLLGLYNGQAFPFDLTDLRALDPEIQRNALAVLAQDMEGRLEVHQWIPGVSEVIATWAADAWPGDGS